MPGHTSSHGRSFLDFGGRWVVVSGASAGLGRAICEALAQHGANLVLIGRDVGRLAETARRLNGTAHRTLPLDLANHASIAPEIQRLRREIGPIYGLCHAAGIVATRPLQANSVSVVQGQLDVNLIAGLELARVICRRDVMTPDEASLLFLSSVYGHVGIAGQIGYCATKGAVLAAVRALAIELARRGVRVNSLSPGLVLTEMTQQAFSVLSQEQVDGLKAAHPLGIGEPVDVARAATFLLAPSNRWITGADLAIDGGFTAQ
jgi:NAD(P)-dependent dehydrogenase (short-subunit alcohol dehydrogenase family)